MRILLLLRHLDAGGTERQFVLLANGLAARGHAVSLATLYPGGSFASALDREVEHHVLFPDTAKRSRLNLLRAPSALRAHARAFRPDLAYSALYLNNAIAYRALRGLFLRQVHV